MSIVLSGCGLATVNGRYVVDGTRDGVPSFRKEAGGDGPSFTIERDSAPDQATQWCLCVDYGFVSYCFCDSETDLPPASGWQVSDECKGPAPTLEAANGAVVELPPTPVAAEEADEEDDKARGDEVHFVKKKHQKATVGAKLSRGVGKKINAQKRSGKR